MPKKKKSSKMSVSSNFKISPVLTGQISRFDKSVGGVLRLILDVPPNARPSKPSKHPAYLKYHNPKNALKTPIL